MYWPTLYRVASWCINWLYCYDLLRNRDMKDCYIVVQPFLTLITDSNEKYCTHNVFMVISTLELKGLIMHVHSFNQYFTKIDALSSCQVSLRPLQNQVKTIIGTRAICVFIQRLKIVCKVAIVMYHTFVAIYVHYTTHLIKNFVHNTRLASCKYQLYQCSLLNASYHMHYSSILSMANIIYVHIFYSIN